VSMEKNKALARAVVESFNQSDLDAAATYLAADYVDYSDTPGTPPGSVSARQRWAMLRAAFSDARVTIDDIVAEGDKVAVRFTLRGTHTGELMGIPPTRRHVVVTGIDINRIGNGQIVERWANFDTLGMLQQLGVSS
jgi:predicted ester cyclase